MDGKIEEKYKKQLKEANEQFYTGIYKTQRETNRIMDKKFAGSEARKGFFLFMLKKQEAELYTMWAKKCNEIKTDMEKEQNDSEHNNSNSKGKQKNAK